MDVRPLLDKLTDVPVLCEMTTINAQLAQDVDDPRWINPSKILAEYVVRRSYEGRLEDALPYDPQKRFIEVQRDAAASNL